MHRESVDFLTKELKEAGERGEEVVVLSHHCPVENLACSHPNEVIIYIDIYLYIISIDIYFFFFSGVVVLSHCPVENLACSHPNEVLLLLFIYFFFFLLKKKETFALSFLTFFFFFFEKHQTKPLTTTIIILIIIKFQRWDPKQSKNSTVVTAPILNISLALLFALGYLFIIIFI